MKDFPNDGRPTKAEEILILQLKGRKCGRCFSWRKDGRCDRSFLNYLIYEINYTNIGNA